MRLDKENTRQILKIVVRAIILFVCLLNVQVIWNATIYLLNIISPFTWGLAIAFILNIFMTIYENKLFVFFELGKTAISGILLIVEFQKSLSFSN